MLSEKDKREIREIFKEELRKALTLEEVVIERTNSDGVVERRTTNLYQPEWIAAEIPNLAHALRGVQETADHAKNNSWKVMLAMDSAMTKFREQLLEDIKQLKYDDAEVLKIESAS